MAISLGSADGDDDVISAINTTPLVDVMLVLLIIFLITIPVVTQTIELELPVESNQALQTRIEDVTLSINREGNIFWNDQPINQAQLLEKLKIEAIKPIQPSVHIRGDQKTRYEAIGKVILVTQQAGINKVTFVIEPPARG